MDDRISILIPCYNAERSVGDAIESALRQTWPNKEVIVVDDGSTDSSLDVIRQFDQRIRWETGPNRGGGAARNRLLELAHGEWLQYLDADDVLQPEKVARQAKYAITHPNCDVLCSPVAWMRVENGQIICTDTVIPEPRDPWILLALWHLPQTSGPLWRKATLQRVGGWREAQPCCQEHELYCRLLENNAHFEYRDGCFAVYRDLDDGRRITRRSKGEFERQKLRILERIEDHLRGTSQLTSARRQAVNDARHDLARRLWNYDLRLSISTCNRILESDCYFQPSRSPSSPPLYSLAFRLLGFHGAQIAASATRALRGWCKPPNWGKIRT